MFFGVHLVAIGAQSGLGHEDDPAAPSTVTVGNEVMVESVSAQAFPIGTFPFRTVWLPLSYGGNPGVNDESYREGCTGNARASGERSRPGKYSVQ